MPDNPLSDEDRDLFQKAMKALKNVPSKDEKADSNVRSKVTETGKPLETVLSNHYTDTVDANSILRGSAAGFPHKRMRDLRLGLIRPQQKVDLHGLPADSAREYLLETLSGAFGAGVRCLLVIHGKGGRHGEAPVLKNLVNHWLLQIPGVLAFHSAVPRDGGTGAVYVLLERH